MVPYSLGAIALHWLSALLILSNLGLGLIMVRLSGLAKFEAFQIHKAIGLTLLLLGVLRVGWRLTHRPPTLPAAMRPWERALARAAHLAFYILLVGLPFVGWLAVSASPLRIPLSLWGLPWPDLPLTPGRDLAEQLTDIHKAIAWSMAMLLIVHLAGVAKHGRASLVRMFPFGSRS